MMESTPFSSHFNLLRLSPSSQYLIVILIIANWNRVMDDITDQVDLSINLFQQRDLLFLNGFLLSFVFILFLDLLFTRVRFIGFLFVFDNFPDVIPFFLQAVERISHSSPLFVHCDHLVSHFRVPESSLKRLSNDINVSSFVLSKPIDIKSWHFSF